MFSLVRSKPKSLPTATDCAAKASFASIRSKSSIFMPALAIVFLVDATGPIPIILGSTPASSPAIQVAIGLTPSSLAFSSLITIIAAAPSLIPDALPAVTSPPSFLNAGFNFERLSTVVLSLGPSSVSKITVSFFFFISTGTISSLNAPALIAATAFC